MGNPEKRVSRLETARGMHRPKVTAYIHFIEDDGTVSPPEIVVENGVQRDPTPEELAAFDAERGAS